MKNKILLFVKLPPPVTGATLINKQTLQLIRINKTFQTKSISISYKNTIESITVFSLRKIAKILSVYFKLIKYLLQFRPQIIYFQISPLGLAFFRDCTYVFLIKLFNVHVLYHMHGKGMQEYIGSSRLKNSIYHWAFRKSSVIILSKSLAYDLEKIFKGLPYIVNNGIPIIEYHKKPLKEIDTIIILFLSNLLFSKGIIEFLDSISLLNKKSTSLKYHCMIIGREVDITAQQLENEILKRDLGCVYYLGPQYNQEKNDIIYNSDILVYPTLNDSYPLTILETMQAGLPVIATREGAIPDIVEDGITGYLVDKHRPDQIAEKLEILINYPGLRKKMGEAGRKKFLVNYTLEIFEQNMVKVFQDVLRKVNAKD